MAETRTRDGIMERKDPITGVWILDPMQFWIENQESMERMMKEMEEESEAERKRMFKPREAEKFLKEDVARYDPDAKDAIVNKVINVETPGVSFGRENKLEIIFDGKFKGKPSRYIAGCWSYSGDFYEPPSEECWFDDFHQTLERAEHNVETHTTVPKEREMWNPELKRSIVEKFNTPEKIVSEKRRLENIYSEEIKRLNYLRKFK